MAPIPFLRSVGLRRWHVALVLIVLVGASVVLSALRFMGSQEQVLAPKAAQPTASVDEEHAVIRARQEPTAQTRVIMRAKSALKEFIDGPPSSPSAEEACRDKLRERGVVLQSGACLDIDGIVASLPTGTYKFKKPDVGWVGQALPFALILQTNKDQQVDINSTLKDLPGVATEREAKFAQNLEATLSGPDLKVDPAGPVQRTATTAEPVEWDWTVTPQAKGEKELTINVTANIVAGTTPTRIQLKVLHEKLNIKVGLIQMITASLAELNGLTAALVTLLTALGGLLTFFRPARHWVFGIFRRTG
jgi:hypothetical protein